MLSTNEYPAKNRLNENIIPFFVVFLTLALSFIRALTPQQTIGFH